LVGDVAHEGYKAYCQNQRIIHPHLPREAAQERYNDAQTDLKTVADEAGMSLVPRKVTPLEDYRTVMVQRALFQGIASMVSFAGRSKLSVDLDTAPYLGAFELG
jgi:fission process protein 1